MFAVCAAQSESGGASRSETVAMLQESAKPSPLSGEEPKTETDSMIFESTFVPSSQTVAVSPAAVVARTQDHEHRLPAPCKSTMVSRDTILSALGKADGSQTISLLAAVGDSHAVLVRSSTEMLTQRSEQQQMGFVLPVLNAIFGGQQNVHDILQRMREFSNADKSHRRSLLRHGATDAVRKIAEHLTEAEVLAFGGLLMSKAQMETLRLLQTHELRGTDTEHKKIARRRYRVADGVLGPRLKPIAHITELLDALHLDLGELHVRPVDNRKWPAQGTARVRDGRAVLLRHLQWLFAEGAFRAALPSVLRLFVRVAEDCGRFSVWSVSGEPMKLGTIAIIADPDVFIAGATAAVSWPLTWLLAAEEDTLDMVQHYARFLPPLLASLQEPMKLRDEAGDVVLTVSCKVCACCCVLAEVHSTVVPQPLLDVGDGRGLQQSTGTPLSTSPFAGFCCRLPRPVWPDLVSVLDALKHPKSLVENAWDLFNNDTSHGFFRADVFLAGLAMPLTKESIAEHIESHSLWALLRVPDLLHVNLNHSQRLRALLMRILPKDVVHELDSRLLQTVGVTLSLGARAGWVWRAIFGATDVWNDVLSRAHQHKLLLLVLSWGACLRDGYSQRRSPKLVARFDANAYVHSVLWCKLYKQRVLLAEHNLFPHLADHMRDLPISYALAETQELTIRQLRRVVSTAIAHGENMVTDALQRSLAFESLRLAKHGLHIKPALPIAMEPCAVCISSYATQRTVVKLADVDTLFPLTQMLVRHGFVRDESWRLTAEGLELFDSHRDIEPPRPKLPSLSELHDRLVAERKARLDQLFAPPGPSLFASLYQRLGLTVAPAMAPAAAEQAGGHGPASAPQAAPAHAHAQAHAHVPVDATDAEPERDEESRDDNTPISEDDYLDDDAIDALFGADADTAVFEQQEDVRERKADPSYAERKQKLHPVLELAANELCPECGRLMRPLTTASDAGNGTSSMNVD